ncbi:MAG TPA: hypothetical protein VKU60_19170, partial [Chloroflexota bacterium]|nr:hypothetical protein [Chloroflexota bacterium]
MKMAEHERFTSSARLNRRELVKLAGGAGVWLSVGAMLAACGSAATPAASSSPVASQPASSSSSAGSPAPSSAAKPAASAAAAKPSAAAAQTDYVVPKSWDEMLAAAKTEGKVVVTSAPDPATRQKLPAAFKDRFGIDMEYLPGASEVTARLQGERAAGQYTVDAEMNGSDS